MGTESSSYLVTVMSYICWCRNNPLANSIWIGRGRGVRDWLVTVSVQAQLVLVLKVTKSDCQSTVVLVSAVGV